jgi:AraC-like DNA-binding protein
MLNPMSSIGINGMGRQGVDSTYFSQTLSTASIAVHERLPMWREVFGQAMVRLDIEPIDDRPFHAEGALCALPGAAYASVTTSPVSFTRTRRLIATDPDPAEKLYLISADAPVEVTQGGKEHVLATGDAIFVRGGEVNRIRCARRSRLTNIAIALDDLRDAHPAADDLAMRVVPRHSDLLGLLHGYVDVARLNAGVAGSAAGPLVSGHVRDLFVAIAASGPEREAVAPPAGMKAARLRAIKMDIAAHLCDSHLDAGGVATRGGISPRYVRRLFQQEGTSFSAYVLGERLERAHRLLLHPGSRDRTITAIAYACGFNDLSYFSRSFRRRFGATPSDLRGAGV